MTWKRTINNNAPFNLHTAQLCGIDFKIKEFEDICDLEIKEYSSYYGDRCIVVSGFKNIEKAKERCYRYMEAIDE